MRLPCIAATVLVSFGICVSADRQEPSQTHPVFRSSTRLVPISVVVTDRAGRIIEGLTRDDFEIRENGKVQRVAAFAIDRAAEGRAAFAPETGPNVFTNVLDGRVGTGATVILFDRMNSTDVDQRRALDDIIKYLKGLDPQERIGFYVLQSDGLLILHDFTQDASTLIRVLNRMTGVTGRETAGSEDTLPRMAPDPDPAIEARFEAALQRAEQMVQMHHIDVRARSTRAALEALTARLAGIAGRKNVIWVTSGFPLHFAQGLDRRSWSEDVYRATRALSHSDTAIYPVHASGLVGAFSGSPATQRSPVDPPTGAATPGLRTFERLSSKASSLDTMHIVAEQTGGRVFKNTNDLRTAVATATDDARLTYVLGYYPTNETWDGGFRKIEVHVRTRRVTVRHRSGYFAHPPLAMDADYRERGLVEALAYPIEATGVGMAVRAERRDGEQLALMIRIDPQSLFLQQEGGRWIGALNVAITQRMPDNRFLRSFEATIPLQFSSGVRASLLKEGLTLNRTIALQSGARQVVVGVRDAGTGARGTVIIDAARVR